MILENNLIQKIENFLSKDSKKQKIIVIYGPTACGKTSLSIDIAKYIKSQIISTDSRQIFKYLDIGTGKVTSGEMQGITHHMIDIITPDIEYSVGEYKLQANKIIKEIHNSGNIPILVGGTGLYIDSLIYDFNIPKIPANQQLRDELENQAKLYGKEFVYNKLCELDPIYAKELHPNNLNYVIRAIEVKLLSGISKKDYQTDKKLVYDTLFITPYDGDRKKLYEKIDSRILKMFQDGLVTEVQNLLSNGFNKTDFGLQTIGYKEVIDYLDGNIDLDKCIQLVQQHNRNYAKRQLTWFGKYL